MAGLLVTSYMYTWLGLVMQGTELEIPLLMNSSVALAAQVPHAFM